MNVGDKFDHQNEVNYKNMDPEIKITFIWAWMGRDGNETKTDPDQINKGSDPNTTHFSSSPARTSNKTSMAALHQTTLVLAKTPLQWAPKVTHNHSLLSSLNFKTNKHHHNQFPRKTLKCSNQYNNSNYNTRSSSNDNVNSGQYYEYERHAAAAAQTTQFPRPTEIEWRKELCNSVQLIGNVGTPVQIKHLSSGKVVAWSRLAVRKSPTDTAW